MAHNNHFGIISRWQIVCATQNPHKRQELEKLLNDPSIELLLPTEVGIAANFDVEETGKTFQENAELKARAFATACGLPVIADDSGICIDALDGEPGVHTKRFAPGTDADRNQILLERLKNQSNRRAVTEGVICLFDPTRQKDQQLQCFVGQTVGTIVEAPRGENGFGFDPIFVPEGSERTFAEMSLAEKNAMSHRGRAIAKFRAFLHTRNRK